MELIATNKQKIALAKAKILGEDLCDGCQHVYVVDPTEQVFCSLDMFLPITIDPSTFSGVYKRCLRYTRRTRRAQPMIFLTRSSIALAQDIGDYSKDSLYKNIKHNIEHRRAYLNEQSKQETPAATPIAQTTGPRPR